MPVCGSHILIILAPTRLNCRGLENNLGKREWKVKACQMRIFTFAYVIFKKAGKV